MQIIVLTILTLVALKAIIVGSEFDFYLWFKHGRQYTQWYFNRPKFQLKRDRNIALPDNMSFDEAITWLYRRREEDDEPVR